MVGLTAMKQHENPFHAVLKQTIEKCEETAREIAGPANRMLFSPNSYNAVSLPILRALCECIWEIDQFQGIPHYSNLGFIFYCDLQVAACQHYFNEYERILGFQDPRPVGGTKIVRPKRRLVDRVIRKLETLVYQQWDKVIPQKNARVGFISNTTFPWEWLSRELRPRKLTLVRADYGVACNPPYLVKQLEVVSSWGRKIHQSFCDIVGSGKVEAVNPVIWVTSWLQQGSGVTFSPNGKYDVLVSGSMTAGQRAFSSAAQASGVPIVFIHHGAQYWMYDEPYFGLYEGTLADTKIVYGNVEEKAKAGALGNTHNLCGRKITFISRTDPLIKKLPPNLEWITPCQELQGKKVLYLATEFESVRYGPHRDVHPGIYLKWQECLLEWIEKQSGYPPSVRYHPKRPSTRYDPIGYEEVNGDMLKALPLADVFVLDYATTSLPYVAATDKPILFFDFGFRRLHSAALRAIKSRCHYAKANLFDPEGAFNAMENDLGRACQDIFTPTFCRSDNVKDEVTVTAETIEMMLKNL